MPAYRFSITAVRLDEYGGQVRVRPDDPTVVVCDCALDLFIHVIENRHPLDHTIWIFFSLGDKWRLGGHVSAPEGEDIDQLCQAAWTNAEEYGLPMPHVYYISEEEFREAGDYPFNLDTFCSCLQDIVDAGNKGVAIKKGKGYSDPQVISKVEGVWEHAVDYAMRIM